MESVSAIAAAEDRILIIGLPLTVKTLTGELSGRREIIMDQRIRSFKLSDQLQNDVMRRARVDFFAA
jgi:hypothetical protein